ncbi:hypothetical protein RHO13_11605 [Orbus wheelerorum]|uniref:DUF7424 family protein n=1 Tax=Orbus wheelerorum TaxID=3074111 RepID=UPI00370D1B2E
MKKTVVIASILLILAGCKVEITTPVNISELNNNTKKIVESQLDVEVASCNDFKDSRKESESLIEAKSSISKIFPKAEFIECYREQFDNKAAFKIPVTVGSKDGDISIYHISSSNSNYVAISENLQNKIKEFKKKSFDKIEPSITILLKNDTDVEQSVAVYSAYINGNGFPLGTLTLKEGNVISIKLSDASIDSIMKRNTSLFMVNLIDE